MAAISKLSVAFRCRRVLGQEMDPFSGPQNDRHSTTLGIRVCVYVTSCENVRGERMSGHPLHIGLTTPGALHITYQAVLGSGPDSLQHLPSNSTINTRKRHGHSLAPDVFPTKSLLFEVLLEALCRIS